MLRAAGLGLGLVLLPACAAEPRSTFTPAAEANASPEAVANARQAYASVFTAVERAAASCEQGGAVVRADLSAALDEAQHGSPRAESTARMFGRLRAERVAFTIVFPASQWTPEVRDGIATRRQQWLALPRDAKAEADLDDLRRTEQSVGNTADELRAQVALFGKAFADAHLDRVTCDQAAQQAAAHLLNFDRPELRRALGPELGRARDLLRRVAQASQANIAGEATATGVVAAYQAAAAHDHPDVVDQALAALRGTLDAPATVSTGAVDMAVERALHAEASRLVQSAADAAGDRSAALYLATVTRDAEAHLTGQVIAPGHGSVLSAGVGGASDGVAAPQGTEVRRMPADGPKGMRTAQADAAEASRAVLDAMYMVTKGDYRAAMKTVAGYVPAPLGGVLAAAK
jgi:hypothetical protein